MSMVIEKIRKNWLVVVLLVVIVWLITKQVTPASYTTTSSKMSFLAVAPTQESNRMVVKNTSLSLKVVDVNKAIVGVVKEAQSLGGFLVESNLDVPEGGATGSISVRIPSDKLDAGLVAIRALGVKVVSENVMGIDVTDQYVDLTARLDTLQKTKAKFEQILAAASRVEDLLNVQRELINLQSQIDSLVGQQKYLEQTAKLSLVTVYLATDELALPYAPAQPWRPSVIFKGAVRTLVGSLRGVGTAVIYIVVFAPIWLPIFSVFWLLNRKTKKI